MEVLQMQNPQITKKFPVKTIAKVGVLSAIAVIVMLFEIPLWFAPSFYKIDLSEVVVLIGAFALGPVAGTMIELIKVLLNLVFNGTITGGIGEAANFVIGCSFIIPAAIIYKKHKTIKGAIIGLIIGIISMTVIGSLLNYVLLLPLYAKIFFMPIDKLVEFGTIINNLKFYTNNKMLVKYS